MPLLIRLLTEPAPGNSAVARSLKSGSFLIKPHAHDSSSTTSMPPKSVVLREHPNPREDDWTFNGLKQLPVPHRSNDGAYMGLRMTFTPENITLALEEFPSNRILQTDDPNLFLIASFRALRFPDVAPGVNIEYITRCLHSGVTLNGRKYFFYGHSNSQLTTGRSCYLRRGNSEAEIHKRVLSLGYFASIKSPAKLAKRIGLLFTETQIDWKLDPIHTRDIPDLESEMALFSDGCGLISRHHARLLAREKQCIFRQVKYVPSVFQIRYKGYKGVLMLHPPLDNQNNGHIHFRNSMRKFTGVPNNSFSVMNYSFPYAYGTLNNEIVTLLSSLGISDEVLLGKLRSYLSWLTAVRTELSFALDYLSSVKQHSLVERILLEGLDSDKIQTELTKALKQEVTKFKDKDTQKNKLRVLVKDSRRLLGVCDPFQILEEGEVFVRVTMPRSGPRSIDSCSVIVVRNPCMYPGDCLKLRAVDKPELRHLVDCVVFASKGKHAAPSLSSGGDLDGDLYTVIWDKDLVPSKVAEPYLYPEVKEEKKRGEITRRDLATHFARYNSISMGFIARLYLQWVRLRPKGAMSQECQELNALYSQCVDGATVKIPDRLRDIPDGPTRFIVDRMWDVANAFAQEWLKKLENARVHVDRETDEQTIITLLGSQRVSLTEFQTIQLVQRLAERSSLDLRPYYSMMDFSSLRYSEKRIIASTFEMTSEESACLWNSLMRSDILPQSAFQRDLREPPLRLQRLYTSKSVGVSGFFEYLKRSMAHFRRRLIVIKTDDRFSAGIFIRGPIAWDEDQLVNQEVAVFALTPTGEQAMSLYKNTVVGYRLHCGHGIFQLFERSIDNTWIFINSAPPNARHELQVSIALQRISSHIKKHVGSITQTPVIDVEIHVVSNQDRLAQQIFDLRLESVVTEERLRYVAEAQPYIRPTLASVKWNQLPDPWKVILTGDQDKATAALRIVKMVELNSLMEFSLRHHAEHRAFFIFRALQDHPAVSIHDVARWLRRYPQLVFTLLHAKMPKSQKTIPHPYDGIRTAIVDAILLFANEGHAQCLYAIEKLELDIASMDFVQYATHLWNTSMVVRNSEIAQDMLVQLDSQRNGCKTTELERYMHIQALQIASERAFEATELCVCDEQGRPAPEQQVTPVRIKIHPKMLKPVSAALGESHSHPIEEEIVATPSSKIPLVLGEVRVDRPSSTRSHSHIRLSSASEPDRQTISWKKEILDGIVRVSLRSQLEIELFHHPPPEYADMEWNMYDCGSTANARAKLDAIQRLQAGVDNAPFFHRIITGDAGGSSAPPVNSSEEILETDWEGFNPSQKHAVQSSCKSHLSLIWGPPGTGKTTVAVKILELLVRMLGDGERILMTASTHNAVDNVLERFAKANARNGWISEDAIIRAATDSEKVNESVQKYTVDALLGGSPMDDPKLIRKAAQRIKMAKIIFSTCAGAGLGALRKISFHDVIIDEASQITEADALVPLVKGTTRAILIGDHVQLRPTLQNMPEKLRAAVQRRIGILVNGGYSGDKIESLLVLLEKQYDMSLFERLYTGPDLPNLHKSILDIQYRFPEHLARFISHRFYQGKLKTGTDTTKLEETLASTSFPWPRSRSGQIIPEAFVECPGAESREDQSFMNIEQAKVIATIVQLLRSPPAQSKAKQGASIVILSPYRGQIDVLRQRMPPDVAVNTIDGFQGKEADIIIFSTVRCNTSKVIGFLADERRLNVAWTRARLGRIIVGHAETLEGAREKVSEDMSRPVVNGLWTAALKACPKVLITLPEVSSNGM